MNSALTRTLGSLAIPGLILASALIGLHMLTPATTALVLETGPPVVLAIGILLSLRFNRSRAVYALLLLTVVEVFSQFVLPGHAERTFLVWTMSAAMPLMLAATSWFKERGLLTTAGLIRLAAFSAPAAAVVYAIQPGKETIRTATLAPLWAEAPDVGVPQTVLIAWTLAAAVLGVRIYKTKSPLDGAFAGAMGALGLALYALHVEQPLTPYLLTGGLIMSVAVVQESYSMAYLDELTKLPGRRALNEEMMKLGRSYAIAMLDVDHFKKFNDTHGHDVGDQVLQLVASKLGAVKGGGKAFRYGGEEFTILFKGKTPDEALPHLEDVRKAIESAKMDVKKEAPKAKSKSKKGKGKGKAKAKTKTVSVTISIGVATRDENFGTPEAVIDAADKALYRAKKGGRNQVSK